MQRAYQTSSAGGRIELSRTNRQLSDHVITAIRCAREGRRAWIKSRSDDDLDRFYAIEYRCVDGELEVTAFESALIINPDAVTAPEWVRQVVTVTRNITNSSQGVPTP